VLFLNPNCRHGLGSWPGPVAQVGATREGKLQKVIAVTEVRCQALHNHCFGVTCGVTHAVLGFVNDPKHWRDRAAEMRVLAVSASDMNTMAIMLRLADDYDRLADRAAMRANGVLAQR
jgi:hypothetical protein